MQGKDTYAVEEDGDEIFIPIERTECCGRTGKLVQMPNESSSSVLYWKCPHCLRSYGQVGRDERP
jgi:hypothetical protein